MNIINNWELKYLVPYSFCYILVIITASFFPAKHGQLKIFEYIVNTFKTNLKNWIGDYLSYSTNTIAQFPLSTLQYLIERGTFADCKHRHVSNINIYIFIYISRFSYPYSIRNEILIHPLISLPGMPLGYDRRAVPSTAAPSPAISISPWVGRYPPNIQLQIKLHPQVLSG